MKLICKYYDNDIFGQRKYTEAIKDNPTREDFEFICRLLELDKNASVYFDVDYDNKYNLLWDFQNDYDNKEIHIFHYFKNKLMRDAKKNFNEMKQELFDYFDKNKK